MPTKIQWCDETWNPVTGCDPPDGHHSEACTNCYARRMATRLRGRFGYPANEPFRVTFHPDRLDQPLKWRKSRRIFVCSMSDLFHPAVAWNWQYKIFEIMFVNPDHTYLVLTKRPKNIEKSLDNIWFHLGRNYGLIKGETEGFPFPLQNFWLGITAENQKRWDERKLFLDIPAAKHFVSLEPLLSDIDLRLRAGGLVYDAHQGILSNKLDWVIIGGLSLPGGKIQPPKREWLDSIVEQCSDAGVPIFIKDNAQYPIERREFPK